MSVIDSHVHIVAPDRVGYPLAPVGSEVADRLVTQPVSAEGLLGEMESCGVDRAVLVQYHGVYGYANAYVVDSISRRTNQVAGVCIIDMLAPRAADTLTDLVVNGGMRGVRMFQTSMEPEAPWLHDPRGIAVWDRARELRVPVVIARAPSAVDPAPERHLPRLRFLLSRYSEVKVALDHLAVIGVRSDGPALPAELLSLSEFPNVYCKLSTVNLYRAGQAGVPYAEYFGPLFERFGADRVMWGSNYPATHDRTYSDMVQLAREALSHLEVSDQELVLGGTALQLWPELEG